MCIRDSAKVTGLSQGDLDAGLPMKEGLQKFLDWAGDDAELAEWGLDDVPVLKQNLFLVGLDENWPNRWYDLQRIFLQAYPRKEGEGLTLELSLIHICQNSLTDSNGTPAPHPALRGHLPPKGKALGSYFIFPTYTRYEYK